MTDAPVDLDHLQSHCDAAARLPGATAIGVDSRELARLIAELRAARAPVESGVELMSCCGGSDEHPPEHTQDCECDCGHELSEHGGHIGSGSECDACSCSRFLPGASRAAPPADEVAGLLADLDMVRGELRDYALEHPSYRALDRIENHLKGKR